MAGNYLGFTPTYADEPGVQLNVGPGVSVKVRKLGSGSDAAESPLTTDSDGAIVAGSIAAGTAGDKYFFRIENFGGRAFSIAQILT